MEHSLPIFTSLVVIMCPELLFRINYSLFFVVDSALAVVNLITSEISLKA